jgi:hypothetical protein
MKFVQLSRSTNIAIAVLAGALAMTAPLRAQLQIGNNLDLKANGTLSTGYSGTYGNQTSSDHSIGVGGSGAVSGYYFTPNFLSFSVTPYYDQARDNSTSRSISDSSGVEGEAQFFGGSRFPASISYSRAYNSEGSFDVPGLADYTSHGNSSNLGLAWGEHVPGLPSLSVSFSDSGSQNSIYGLTQTSSSNGHSLNFNSNYQLRGFGLGGSYFLGGSSSEYPDIFAGVTKFTTSSSADHGYTFTASHRLPWNGSVFGTYSSSTVDSNYLSTRETYTVGNFNTAASVQPTQKLQLSAGMSYSDNVSGSIEQAVLASGAVVTQTSPSSPSHAYDFTGAISYSAARNLRVQGDIERRVQAYQGLTLGATAYAANTSYWRKLFGGHISTALTVQDSTVDNNPASSLGINANTSYNRRIGNWSVDSSFNYAQNMQTLLVTYTTSQYGYGGSVRRKLGHGITWTLSVGASSTGLTGQSGTTSQSKSAGTGLGLGRWAHLGATYSQSTGNGILTAAGIASSPVPVTALPGSSIVLYGGKSYSYSIGSTPVRRFTVSAAYSRSDSNTGILSGSSTNVIKTFNTLLQYQFRKMYLTAGFSQLTQGFSASGTAPQTVSSFYIGISRWFNFF